MRQSPIGDAAVDVLDDGGETDAPRRRGKVGAREPTGIDLDRQPVGPAFYDPGLYGGLGHPFPIAR